LSPFIKSRTDDVQNTYTRKVYIITRHLLCSIIFFWHENIFFRVWLIIWKCLSYLQCFRNITLFSHLQNKLLDKNSDGMSDVCQFYKINYWTFSLMKDISRAFTWRHIFFFKISVKIVSRYTLALYFPMPPDWRCVFFTNCHKIIIFMKKFRFATILTTIFNFLAIFVFKIT
jgi:hypothetical protein